MNMNKHIWEGWTVGDFIKEIKPMFYFIMQNRSHVKPFKDKDELKKWIINEQPHYKKHIPEVYKYFEKIYNSLKESASLEKKANRLTESLLLEKKDVDSKIVLGASHKKFWVTPLSQITKCYGIYCDMSFSEINNNKEVIERYGNNAGIDIFKNFIKELTDSKNHISPKIGKMLGLPLNTDLFEFYGNPQNSTGLNGDSNHKKYKNFGGAMYDIYEAMVKKFGFSKQVKKNIGSAEELLKYGIKDLKAGLTLDILKKKFSWVLKAKLKDAIISLENNKIHFDSGVWENGVWENGWFDSGTWKNGTWKNGTFYRGVWENGVFENGNFDWDATWENGVFKNGNFMGVVWKNGTFENGTFSNSIWKKGIWKNGVFKDSKWLDKKNPSPLKENISLEKKANRLIESLLLENDELKKHFLSYLI